MEKARVDIVIRSYAGDFGWLSYCLKSCAKFARGFGKVNVIVPASDFVGVSHLTREVVHITNNDRCRGYMAQQITKLHADEFSNADYVCFLDSDTIWTGSVSPSDLMPRGKAVILWENGVDHPWSPIVEKCLGFPMRGEFMRRHPFVYPRWVFSEFRAWFKKSRKMEIDDYIAQQPGNAFSEFNVLGSWCWEFHKDSFDWRLPETFPVFVRQGWSHNGVDREREELERLLA